MSFISHTKKIFYFSMYEVSIPALHHNKLPHLPFHQCTMTTLATDILLLTSINNKLPLKWPARSQWTLASGRKGRASDEVSLFSAEALRLPTRAMT
jgi:hypothetical protein